jgi:hypothetical protein
MALPVLTSAPNAGYSSPTRPGRITQGDRAKTTDLTRDWFGSISGRGDVQKTIFLPARNRTPQIIALPTELLRLQKIFLMSNLINTFIVVLYFY